MQAGYIAMMIFISVLILCATGWKEQLIGQVRSRYVAFFLFFWFVGLWIHVPVGYITAKISGSLIIALLYSLYTIWNTRTFFDRFYLLSTACLVAAALLFLVQFVRVYPNLLIWSAQLDGGILVGLILGIFLVKTEQLVATMTLGLLAEQVIYDKMSEVASVTLFGDKAFFDQWWLGLLVAKFISWILNNIHRRQPGYIDLNRQE